MPIVSQIPNFMDDHIFTLTDNVIKDIDYIEFSLLKVKLSIPYEALDRAIYQDYEKMSRPA